VYENVSGKRVQRRLVTEWVVLYRSRGGNEVKVTSIGGTPSRVRVFRTHGKTGRRKYKAVAAKRSRKEIWIVAKAKTKKSDDVLTEEDLQELEDLEDLEDEDLEDEEDEEEEDEVEDVEEEEDEDEDEEDLEDEDLEDVEEEDEDEDEEEEEEEEEPPRRRRRRRGKKSKSKRRRGGVGRALPEGKVGVEAVAKATGADGRTVRMVLRKEGIDKDEDSGRYAWPSESNREFKRVVKLVKERGNRVKQESLENLKKRKKTRTKATSKKGSTRKRTRSTSGRKRARSKK
jgi:hypothetical protein